MLTLSDIDHGHVAALLGAYGLQLVHVDDGETIPGSYWGEPEAGLVGATVYARADTPVHSLLHEAAHLIVLPPEKRTAVHTDATDSIAEEDAVLAVDDGVAVPAHAVGDHRDAGRLRFDGNDPEVLVRAADHSSCLGQDRRNLGVR